MDINDQVRKLRSVKGITLQQLSDRTGLSKGYLSKIERSHSPPPFATLQKLAQAFHVDMNELFRSDGSKSGDFENLDLITEKERKKQKENITPSGYEYRTLVNSYKGKYMLPVLMTIRKGKQTSYFSHDAEEFVYILQGEVIFYYEGKEHHLKQGDSLYFDSREKHRFTSLNSDTTLITVNFTYRKF